MRTRERSHPIPTLSDADRRDEVVVLRRDYLRRQLEALRTRVRMLEGVTLTFDGSTRTAATSSTTTSAGIS